MAKGIIKQVAQRLMVTGHYRNHGSTAVYRLQASPEQGNIVDHGLPTGKALWMKPSATSSSYFKEPVEARFDVDQLKDDEEIKRELLSTAIDSESRLPLQTPVADTHAIVKLLIESGFTSNQAEALTMTLTKVVTDSSSNLHSSMVSKSQAELTLQKVASQLAILRRDMIIMEKSDFTELVAKIERVTYELEQLQRMLRDEIIKISSNLTLDINLEKAKVKDLHLDHLRTVEQKHGVVLEKINSLDKELQNVRSYINTENAALQTTFERYKSDTIKLAFGSVATCMTIVLGFYRLWS